MPSSATATDLLCAVLALRLRYVRPDELAAVMLECQSDGSSSLELALAERGLLTASQVRLIETLQQCHLERRAGDAARCLADLGVHEDALESLLSSDVSQLAPALAKMAPAEGADPALASDAERPAASEHSPATLSLLATASTADGRDSSEGGRSLETQFPRSAASPQRFRKLRMHAQGGLGKISLADDEQLHRRVALKEILEQRADSPDDRARFVREAEITGALEHPGIVPVYELGRFADGRPYYAMRFIRGDSLQAAIERLYHADRGAGPETILDVDGGEASDSPSEPEPAAGPESRAQPLRHAQRRRELRRLLQRFQSVCQTIHYAHSRGVIHRDLKPANIMLGKHGETLVVDWGLAKSFGDADFQVDDSSSDLRPLAGRRNSSTVTVAGRVVGTPGFMAPEQAEGNVDNLTAAADIYSLGATLYCLLTGRSSPFQGSTLRQAIELIRHGDFPRPRQVNRDVPPALEAICLKAMAVKPEDRYRSAAELVEEVDRWLADEPVLAWREPLVHRAARWMRRHRSWTLAGAAALVLIAVVSTASAVWVGAARSREAIARQNEAVERQRAESQKEEAERLAATLLVKDVEALRRDQPPGWTWIGLDQLAKAVQLAPDALDRVQVRSLAAACLTSVDARQSGEYARSQVAHCVAFSPDGRTLAVAASKSGWTNPGTVTLANLAAGKERTLAYPRDVTWELFNGGRTDGGRSLAFSPDGRWLVVGTRSGWIHRFDLSQPAPEPQGWKPVADDVEVHDLLFSAAGESLYAVSRNVRGAGHANTTCTVSRWPVASWPSAPAAVAELPGVVYLARSEDERLLFATGSEAHWLDGQTLAVVRTSSAELSGEAAGCPAAGFLASEDAGTPHVLDESSDRIFLRLRDDGLGTGHAGSIRRLSFHPTGRLLASGANEDGVKLWDLLDGSLAVSLPLPGSETTFPAFSADGRRLASPAARSTIAFDVRGGDVMDCVALQAGEIVSFAWSAGGDRLFIAARGQVPSQLVLADWSEGVRTELGAVTAGPESAPPQWAVHPSGQALCVIPGASILGIDSRAGAEAAPLELDGQRSAIAGAFSRDGSRLWLVEGNNRVSAWDVGPEGLAGELKFVGDFTTQGLDILTGRDNIQCLAAAGERSLIGLDNGMVMMIDAGQTGPARYWTTPAKRIQALAVSGDQRLAAAGTDGGRVALIDLAKGRIVANLLPLEQRGVASLTLDGRGELLAVGSDAGNVQLWRRGEDGFERLLTLREADGRAATLRFHPTQARLTAHFAAERGLQVWRLDALKDALRRIGAGW
ncbi:MAG: protein kinase [Planctomycetes bacterium]|nr:protein kinase [Planctomycetota bacterium]